MDYEKEFETTLGEAYVSHEVYEEVDEDDKHKEFTGSSM